MNMPSPCRPSGTKLFAALHGKSQATASMAGSESYPDISGTVRFFQTNQGVIVCAEICGLPKGGDACHERIFGFHIHEGPDCGGMDGPFPNVMSHYNPDNCEHPYHAGDLPPLFGNDGFALSAFLTNRITVDDVIGRTVIIHDHPDDFTTQPSGNSGTKIACGVIRRVQMSCG